MGITKCDEYIELFDWVIVELNQSEYLLYRRHKLDLSGQAGVIIPCSVQIEH